MISPWRTLIDVALDAAEAAPSDVLAVRRLRDAIPREARVPVEAGKKLTPDHPVNQLWKAAREYVRPSDYHRHLRSSAHCTEFRRQHRAALASAARLARAYLDMLDSEGAGV